MHMPNRKGVSPRGDQWQLGRAELDLTSEQAAAKLRIAGGSLRSIENELQSVSLALACRAARLYGVNVNTLIRSDSTQPDEKPEQPKGPKGPGTRKDKKKRGPKRPGDGLAAAS
jgi:DNA-binding XRE family transcriptional regulator